MTSEPTLERVTPAIARQWLRRAQQKRLDMDKARRLCFAMMRGEWEHAKHAHRPCIIRAGRLVDGNHRTVAALLYGKPVELWVLHE